MFFVAGIGVAVLIEFLLITKKNKGEPDRILTLWMFLILLHLFLFYIFFSGDVYKFPWLLGIEIPLPLLQGFFLYLYVGSLTGRLPERREILLLHFIPAILMYLYLTSFFFLPGVQKVHVYENRGAGYEKFIAIKNVAIMSSGIIYVAWSLYLLKMHRHNIRDRFSNLDKVNLEWLQLVTLGMGGVWCLVIFLGSDVVIYSGVVVFVFLVGFFGFRQSDIFAHSEPDDGPAAEKEKYSRSGLSEETSDKLRSELKRLMSEEALYRNSELSVGDLAAKLGVHPNYLSQVINEKEGKNFYDFVNSYRVEEFRRLMAVPKNRHLTLLSLAFDCGFNSKSSFNRYFKKATGQTPSQYFDSLPAA